MTIRGISKSKFKRSVKWDSWGALAFVFGLVFVQGIVYVTKVGNLYVDVVYPFAVIVLSLNFAFRPRITLQSIESCFYKGMTPFLSVVVLSVFLAVGSSITHVGVHISSCVNGLVVLLFSLIIYFAVISLRDRMRFLVRGLFFGLLVNILVSFFQYAAFQSGTAFTLYDYFPQPAFYISVPWGAGSAWAQNLRYLVYSFRAQGLYLEVSYFVGAATMIYVVSMGFLDMSGTAKAVVFLLLLFLFAMSNTGNLVLFIGFTLLTHFLLSASHDKTTSFLTNKRSSAEWIVQLVVIAVLVGLCIYALSNIDDVTSALDVDNLVKGLQGGIESSDISNSDNRERFLFMQNGLSEFMRYPWGGGYNMAPTLTFYDFGTNATFSYVLTLLVEMGPIGLIAYGYLVLSMVLRLLVNDGRLIGSKACVAVALIALLVFQTGNGIGLTPIAWVIFALASIEIVSGKDELSDYCCEGETASSSGGQESAAGLSRNF